MLVPCHSYSKWEDIVLPQPRGLSYEARRFLQFSFSTPGRVCGARKRGATQKLMSNRSRQKCAGCCICPPDQLGNTEMRQQLIFATRSTYVRGHDEMRRQLLLPTLSTYVRGKIGDAPRVTGRRVRGAGGRCSVASASRWMRVSGGGDLARGGGGGGGCRGLMPGTLFFHAATVDGSCFAPAAPCI